MTADPPPDVRDRAVKAAHVEHLKSDAWSPEHWTRVVDAVVDVVAPEIERPLQARVELLTAALTELVQLYDGTHAMFTTIPRSIACGPITKVFEDAHDRARAALAAGVTNALPLDAFRNLPDWVPDLTPEQHHTRYLEMLREREQADGVTESEAP